MLYVPHYTQAGFSFNNFGANPSTTPGTSVIPGTSNAEGSWTQVASSSDIVQDVYNFYLRVLAGATSGQSKMHLLDIGVDPAGGTSYVAIISNLACGGSSAAFGPGEGEDFLFPFFIKAGSSVAVRIQGSNATAGTIFVGVMFFGQLSRPEVFPVGSFSETMGAITNSNGVSFIPGNAANGDWVSLGTTTKALWWWQIGCQVDISAAGTEQTYVELAYGNTTNRVVISRILFLNTGEAYGFSPAANCLFECYCPVLAGGELWIRGRCSNAPNTGYNGVAVGIGG